MKRLLVVALLTGCSSKPAADPLALTPGVAVSPPGCPYTFTTPNETTQPVNDDGSFGAVADPRDLHLSWVGDPTSSVTVTWATDVATRSTALDYGATAA